MKTFLASLLILFLLHFTSFSQNDRRVMLGGTVSFDMISGSNDYKAAYLQIIPKVGYLVTPQLALGIDVGFQYDEGYFFSDYGYHKSIERTLGFAFFLRYQKNIAGNFKFFFEPASWVSFHPGDDSGLNSLSIITDLGILYSIKEFMSVEISVLGFGVSEYWMKGSDSRLYEFYIDYALLTPNIGILFYL